MQAVVLEIRAKMSQGKGISKGFNVPVERVEKIQNCCTTIIFPEALVSKARLAVIGCGAVTEFVYLPVSMLSDRFEVVALVDPVTARAEALAGKYGIGQVAGDHRALVGSFDAAIVAAPNHLHASITLELLNSGVPVLVEKPMAMSALDCRRMTQASRTNHTVLGVGLVRRLYRNSLFIKEVLAAEMLGEIRRVEIREGCIFNWRVRSDSLFRRDTGGGVLADIGSHILDLLLWWMGEYESFEYFDDSFGGTEANCEIRLRMKSGAAVQVELSSSRALSNTFIFEGERAVLEVGTGFDSAVTLRCKGVSAPLVGSVPNGSERPETFSDLYLRQIHDFIDAIQQGRPPLVDGEEGGRAVGLIEACHAERQMLYQPWVWQEAQVQGVLQCG